MIGAMLAVMKAVMAATRSEPSGRGVMRRDRESSSRITAIALDDLGDRLDGEQEEADEDQRLGRPQDQAAVLLDISPMAKERTNRAWPP